MNDFVVEITIHALSLFVLMSLVVKAWDAFMVRGERSLKMQLVVGMSWMALIYVVAFGYSVFIIEVHY